MAAVVPNETKEVAVQHRANKMLSKTFFFDNVCGPTASQKDVFTGTVLPIVEEV